MSTPARPAAPMSPEKKRLLSMLLKEKEVKAPAEQAIPRAAGGGPLPLSSGQKRLWFLDRLSPGTPLYNVPALWRLRGQLDAAALSRSLSALAARHGALRTCYPERGGSPAQLVLEATPLALPVVDLASLPGAERVERARRLLRRDARRPFDLSKGPVVRALLVRLSEEEHLLQLTAHHIATDGWSVGVIEQELRALYAAELKGEPAGLAPLSISYADYAAWQEGQAESAEAVRQLGYWKERLAGAPPPPEWPGRAERAEAQEADEAGARKPWAGGEVRFVLGARTSEGVRELALRCGATPFMVLLSALKVVLWRQTGQPDVIVGTVVANRRRAELEGLVGFFVNTLALRTDLSGGPSFESVIGRVKETCLGAYANQDVAFERVVDAVKPERGAGGGGPLFSVMAVLQNGPGGASDDVGGVVWSRETASAGAAKFDLTLTMEETADGRYACELTYALSAFSREAGRSLARQFARVLRGGVRGPQEHAGRLRLLNGEERRRAVDVWGRGEDVAAVLGTGSAWAGGVVRVFEGLACGDARERAAVCGGRKVGASGEAVLSYGELNARANQLARHLRQLGVTTEGLVGVLLDGGTRWVQAILGILKAGAAYVPLDAEYPAERLKYMIEDVGLSVVLTEESLLEKLPETRARAVCVDKDWDEIARHGDENLGHEVEPENLAYVIYTSGSTGNPKGVQVQHGSLMNLVRWQQGAYGITSEDRGSQLAGMSFDATVLELWPYLTAGATVLFADEETRLNPARLVEWFAEKGITSCMMPTPLAEAAMQERWPEKVALRSALIGGDRLRRAAVRELPFKLLNNYGPTESTVVATWGEVDVCSKLEPSIGRPISNTRAYVLDEWMEVVPVGVVGELYVGGAGLSRGYANRPGLTAERFVPDSVSGEAGTRLYRTGDLVRYRENGELEYVGRADNQVKVRGHRIELGEIEAALGEYWAVRHAVVVAKDGADAGRRLVAYVVAYEGVEPTDEELRGFLRKKLPAYMVPSAFVTLEEFPLTPNGKIDQKALPAPASVRDDRGEELPPRDAFELRLARMLEELLGVSPVGVRQNLFDIGMHSLLAVRFMAHVEREFGRALPLSTIFQAATVENLASLLRKEAAAADDSPLVPILQGGTKRPFFCVHAGGGNTLSYIHLARHLGAERSFYGLEPRPPREGARRYKSIEEMAAHYVAAVRGAQPEGPYQLGGWSMGGIIAYEMARQLTAAGQDVSLLALMDTHLNAYEELAEGEADRVLSRKFAQNLGVDLSAEQAALFDRPQSGRDELLGHALALAKEAGVMPPDIDLAQFARLYDTFRDNMRATCDYRPRRYEGRVVFFRPAERLAESLLVETDDGRTDWHGLADGGVEVEVIPGDHFTMVREPHAGVLADRLKAHMGQ